MKKRKEHFHGSLENENGGWRKVEDEVRGWSHASRGPITLPALFTKLPL